VQRLLASAVETLAGRPARGSEIARLAARLGAGATGTLAGIVARPGTIWQLSVTRPPQTGGKKPQNAA
jgi:tRNA(Ile)-lysidine synthase